MGASEIIDEHQSKSKHLKQRACIIPTYVQYVYCIILYVQIQYVDYYDVATYGSALKRATNSSNEDDVRFGSFRFVSPHFTSVHFSLRA
jgi:hypothetical protein